MFEFLGNATVLIALFINFSAVVLVKSIKGTLSEVLISNFNHKAKVNHLHLYSKRSVVMDQMISIGNLITQLFLWNFDKISVLQAVTVGYTKSYHSEKLACQNCQMICRPYYWDKQYGNISPLILMIDWLMVMHCSQETKFHFLSVVNGPTSTLSARSHFWGIFLNCHEYFQEIFLGHIRDVTE